MRDAVYYPPCYALVSGGKDSLSAAQVLSEAGKLLGCVSFETGISTPDWKGFVQDTCAERSWPLEFFHTGDSYDDLVRKFGFPGPGKHGLFMNYLKGRGVRKFKKTHPDGVLASGVRRNESTRRLTNTRPVSFWEGVPILAPIFDWTTEETWEFFHSRGFKRAPAYSLLMVSGDCLCGAFAQQGEAAALRLAYPCTADRLDKLGREISDAFPSRCKWGWGWDRPRTKFARQASVCVECGDADEQSSDDFPLLEPLTSVKQTEATCVATT